MRNAAYHNRGIELNKVGRYQEAYDDFIVTWKFILENVWKNKRPSRCGSDPLYVISPDALPKYIHRKILFSPTKDLSVKSFSSASPSTFVTKSYPDKQLSLFTYTDSSFVLGTSFFLFHLLLLPFFLPFFIPFFSLLLFSERFSQIFFLFYCLFFVWNLNFDCSFLEIVSQVLVGECAVVLSDSFIYIADDQVLGIVSAFPYPNESQYYQHLVAPYANTIVNNYYHLVVEIIPKLIYLKKNVFSLHSFRLFI